MGYRLTGKKLKLTEDKGLVSSAVNFGTVQMLPDGQLIILMADHQTTGGYPRIANIISAHLPQMAQMNPGEEVKFRLTTINKAEQKLAAQQKQLTQIQNHCKLKMQKWLDAN